MYMSKMNVDKMSVFITLAVLSVLVLASPTMATINAPDNKEIVLGESFEFDIEKINDPSSFNVTMMNGTYRVLCEFDLKGNNLKKLNDGGSIEGTKADCKGIKIQKPGCNYGYGHNGYMYRVRFETNKGFIKNHGALLYKITLKADGAEDFFYLNVTPGKKNK